MTQAMKVVVGVVSLCCLLVVSQRPACAADANSIFVRGDIARVDLVYDNGVYEKTYLHVWSDAPQTQLRPHLFRCDGNAYGFSVCKNLNSLLPCVRTETELDAYGSGRVIMSYACKQPARRDAGTCVNIGAHITALYDNVLLAYSDYDAQYELYEMLGLDIDSLGIVTSGFVPASEDCTVKP